MRSFPTEVETAMIGSQDRFVWEMPAFYRHERGKTWYFGLAVLSVLLIAYAVWTANFLFAFIIFLAAIILLLVGSQEPRHVLVQIGDNGIVVDGKLHLYQDIGSFGIVYQPPIAKVLYVEPKSTLSQRMRLELMDQDPVELRSHLRQYLQEDLDLQGEHLSDIVGRLLRI
ncbi:hypothetical protein K8R04_02470 [Candidatus Uhrbacteria bacterium]|nr:hypothetical protein [Candidatus Uhrbacteria bacterium]